MVYLLLKASVEIYSGAGWIHKGGEFPSLKTQDFPISEQAQRFYKSGGSVLYDSLPFWAATFIDRMLLLLIPLGVILIPYDRNHALAVYLEKPVEILSLVPRTQKF